jgi:hypothetical protein
MKKLVLEIVWLEGKVNFPMGKQNAQPINELVAQRVSTSYGELKNTKQQGK